MSIDQIEYAWLRESPRAICDVVREYSSESFYAAAFWLFYSDYNQILTPALAINAESFITTHQGEHGPWNTRWVPAEWHWPVLDDPCDAIKPAYAQLSETMASASESEWDELLDSHDQMMARVARELTSQIRDGAGDFHSLNVPAHFLVAAIDDQRDTEDYNALVRASVEPHHLAQFDAILFQ